ncbi:hypothetical protein C8J56DRAFT_881845 [Mycena floridula]|nr:hypothetical protein C8J56DRAFT_881845 [Mycena floridula]
MSILATFLPPPPVRTLNIRPLAARGFEAVGPTLLLSPGWADFVSKSPRILMLAVWQRKQPFTAGASFHTTPKRHKVRHRSSIGTVTALTDIHIKNLGGERAVAREIQNRIPVRILLRPISNLKGFATFMSASVTTVLSQKIKFNPLANGTAPLAH